MASCSWTPVACRRWCQGQWHPRTGQWHWCNLRSSRSPRHSLRCWDVAAAIPQDACSQQPARLHEMETQGREEGPIDQSGGTRHVDVAESTWALGDLMILSMFLLARV